MRIPVLVLLLAFSILLIIASPFILHAADPPECATCEQLINAPQTGVFVLVNDAEESNRYLNIIAYYENLSASPSRQNLSNTILLVELTSPTGTYELFRTYTNQNGTAKFRFSDYDSECLNFKVLYCPYCVPPELECEGFKQCVEFGHLDTPAVNAQEVDPAADAVILADSELNQNKYLPSLGTATWCPPPPALAATPALCFPLILIFSLLSGALYLTGRNPFAGFNIGGMRVGQHIKYQARGRGFSFSFAQLAMAAMSVGEAVQTARKQGGGALVKREKDAANARGLGGLYGKDSSGKSGFAIGVRQQIGAYQAGRASQATANTAAGGKGKGKGGAATPVRGGSSVPSSTGSGGGTVTQGAGGMQTGLTGGGGTSGADILGGKSVTIGPFSGNMINSSSILRIATFICLNTTLGRAIDAFYTASTYNSEAGRGRNLFDQAFADRTGRVVDAAATLAGLRGPNGGTMIRVLEGSGEGRMVEAMPVPQGRPAVPEGQTEYAIAVPRGTGPGESPSGLAIIRINTNSDSPTRGQILFVETTVRVTTPVLDKQGQPVMVPVLDKQGQPVMGENNQPRTEQQTRSETLNVRQIPPSAENNYQPTIQVQTQVPDPSSSTGQTMSVWQNATPAQVSQITPQFNQIVAPLGDTFKPGVIAAPFVDSYNTHMQGVQALQQTIQTETAFLREDQADRMRSEADNHPTVRDGVQSHRYDVAAEGVSRLGIPLDDVRLAGTGNLFDGLNRGESDLAGHTRSAQETVVLAVHTADESAGPRSIGVPSLTSLAGASGVSAIASDAGLSDSSQAAARSTVPTLLSRMSVGDISNLTPERLQAHVLGIPVEQVRVLNDPSPTAISDYNRTRPSGTPELHIDTVLTSMNQTRASNGQPPITSMEDVRAVASLAPSISSIATEFTQNLRSTPGFTGYQDNSGRTLLDRVTGSDLSTIAAVGNAGHLVSPEGTGALLSRPEVYNDNRITESMSQAAREYNALDRLSRVSSSGDPVAAAGQINSALFDYSQTVMVNRSGVQLPGESYAQATSGLDHNAHYSALSSTSFGSLPAQPTRPSYISETDWPAVAPSMPSIEQVETLRREQLGQRVSSGDFGTARAIIGDAVSDYNTAARSARALGDEDRARMLETAAAGYAHAYTSIDACEADARGRGTQAHAQAVETAISSYFPLTHPPPPSPPPPSDSSSPAPTPTLTPPPPPRVGSEISGTVYTVVDSASVASAFENVRSTHLRQGVADIDRAQRTIVDSLPREKRPQEMQDVARVNPLTPTIPGLDQGSHDST